MIDLEKHFILEKYLRLATNSITPCISKTNKISIRCNICGDSKHRKAVLRGHLLRSVSKDTFEEYWAYKCFNEGCMASGEGGAWSGDRWLRVTSPTLYSQFRKEWLTTSNNKKTNDKELKKLKREAEHKRNLEELYTRKKVEKIEKENCKYFLSINSIDKAPDLIKLAINFCQNRKIPETVWRKWFVCIDGMYKDRLVIPFYDPNGNIYYYQCRSLKGQEPKYLNRLKNKDKSIYNLDYIDKTKPVILLEGIIDSLFVENSIAMLGLSYSKKVEEQIKNLDVYYLLDNDKAGKQRGKKLLEKGNPVFLWNRWKYSNYKDINDVIIGTNINNFSYDDIKDYFSTNCYDKLYLEI